MGTLKCSRRKIGANSPLCGLWTYMLANRKGSDQKVVDRFAKRQSCRAPDRSADPGQPLPCKPANEGLCMGIEWRRRRIWNGVNHCQHLFPPTRHSSTLRWTISTACWAAIHSPSHGLRNLAAIPFSNPHHRPSGAGPTASVAPECYQADRMPAGRMMS